MKVAIVHDWLTGMRGGERCLEVFCELFPLADIYTLLHIPGSTSSTIEKMSIKTSFIQNLPFAKRGYRKYLSLFPLAVEHFNLKGYDLILSCSHCVAKGIIPPPDALHISYLLTPMRYAWDMYEEYFGAKRSKLIPPLHSLPQDVGCDVESACGPFSLYLKPCEESDQEVLPGGGGGDPSSRRYSTI